jgi:hypothetical protein
MSVIEEELELSEIEEFMYEWYTQNYKDRNLIVDGFDDASEIINYSFSWEKSRKGWFYWSKISDKVSDYEEFEDED